MQWLLALFLPLNSLPAIFKRKYPVLEVFHHLFHFLSSYFSFLPFCMTIFVKVFIEYILYKFLCDCVFPIF